MQKHWRAAAKLAAEFGYELTTGKRGHAHLRRPGHRPIPVSSSPRDEGDMLKMLRRQLAAEVKARQK